MITKIHEGAYGNHTGGRFLVVKVLRAGYFQLTMRADCTHYINKSDKCLWFSEVPQKPPKMTLLLSDKLTFSIDRELTSLDLSRSH